MSLIMNNFDVSESLEEHTIKIDELKELVKNLTIKNEQLEEQVKLSNNDQINNLIQLNTSSSDSEGVFAKVELVNITNPELGIDKHTDWLMESQDLYSDNNQCLSDWLVADLEALQRSNQSYDLLNKLRDISRGIPVRDYGQNTSQSSFDPRTFTRGKRRHYEGITRRKEECVDEERVADTYHVIQDIKQAARIQEESLKATSSLGDSGLGRDLVDGATGSSPSLSDSDRPTASVDGSLHSSSPPDSPYSSQSLDQPTSRPTVTSTRTAENLRGSLPNLSYQRGLSRPQRGLPRRVADNPRVANPSLRRSVGSVVKSEQQQPVKSGIPSRLPRGGGGGIPRPTSSKLHAPKYRSNVQKWQQNDNWKDGCF